MSLLYVELWILLAERGIK